MMRAGSSRGKGISLCKALESEPAIKHRCLLRLREGLAVTSDYSGWCFAEFGIECMLGALEQQHYCVPDAEYVGEWSSRVLFHSANDNDATVLAGTATAAASV